MKKFFKFIFTGFIIMVIIILISFGGRDFMSTMLSNSIDSIELEVANEAIDQYDIAKRNGDKLQAYLQAGIISAAFLQAKDEENYKKWKNIEKQEAKNVGIHF
jgi:hypothetical protein